jgi:hypothetical protein
MVDSKKQQVNLLLKSMSDNINQISSSVLLKRIAKLSNSSHTKSSHDSHCLFDKSGGGGHGNICWKEKIAENPIENSSIKR